MEYRGVARITPSPSASPSTPNTIIEPTDTAFRRSQWGIANERSHSGDGVGGSGSFHQRQNNTNYPHEVDKSIQGRDYSRMSVSSASTTSSGTSSLAGRGLSCSSPESSDGSSPPFSYSPLPTTPVKRDAYAVTKIEELDDDDQLMRAPPLLSLVEIPEKRGRGRPRKHPVAPLKVMQKITKGRSKTGCITCRRRKKKCDETKPECTSPHLSIASENVPSNDSARVFSGNNCVKNSVVCQGYPEKTYWQPGRQKTDGMDPISFVA